MSGAKLQFTVDPNENTRFPSSSGGTAIGFKFKFQNVGDDFAQQGQYTNSYWAINNTTSDTNQHCYYPPTDLMIGSEYEDYIQLEGLASGPWELYVALNTMGQVALAGGYGADDGRIVRFEI
jgi:hypothetical protein